MSRSVESTPFFNRLKAIFSVALVTLLLRESIEPQPVYSQIPQETTSVPTMYEGIDIRSVPEMQLFFTARFKSMSESGRSANCSASILLDPKNPGKTRFGLTAMHCAVNNIDRKLNPSSSYFTPTGNPDPLEVSQIVQIPGTQDSALIIFKQELILNDQVTGLALVAQEANPPDLEVLSVGYGRWENGPSPASPLYGEFNIVPDCMPSPALNIMPANNTQPAPGDSGAPVVISIPTIEIDSEGNSRKLYQVIGTVHGSCDELNFDNSGEIINVPTIVSPINSPQSVDAINGLMDKYRSGEHTVPDTQTDLLINGIPSAWKISNSDTLYSSQQLTRTFEIRHKNDDSGLTTTEVSSMTISALNDATCATVTSELASNPTTLQDGLNPVAKINISSSCDDMSPYQNQWLTYRISAQIKKNLPNGEIITEGVDVIDHYDVSNPRKINIETIALNKTAVFTDVTGTVSAQKIGSSLIFEYEGSARPKKFYFKLTSIEDESIENFGVASFTWTPEQKSSTEKLSTEFEYPLPYQLLKLTKLHTFLPDIRHSATRLETFSTHLPEIVNR